MPGRYNMLAVPELEILISRNQIAERVAAIAAEITRDFLVSQSFSSEC
jgi:hypoxanthine-guanine phosphoribosyltransferase